MPRTQSRGCLEHGLKLDLSWLLQKRLLRPQHYIGPWAIRWKQTDTGVLKGLVTADMRGRDCWLHIQVGKVSQTISLVWHSRHFGGGQWYFICPVLKTRATILWLPMGAEHFACSRAWKSQAGYASQFLSRRDRAISVAMSIRKELGGPTWIPLSGAYPPRPKGMRRQTYWRLIHRCQLQEQVAFESLNAAAFSRSF